MPPTLATARPTRHCQPRHGCQEAPNANSTSKARNKSWAAPAPPRGRKCPSQHRTLKTRDCRPRGWHKGTPGTGTRGGTAAGKRGWALEPRSKGGFGIILARCGVRKAPAAARTGSGSGNRDPRTAPRRGVRTPHPTGMEALSRRGMLQVCRDTPECGHRPRQGPATLPGDPLTLLGARSPFWGPRRPLPRRRGCSPRSPGTCSCPPARRSPSPSWPPGDTAGTLADSRRAGGWSRPHAASRGRGSGTPACPQHHPRAVPRRSLPGAGRVTQRGAGKTRTAPATAAPGDRGTLWDPYGASCPPPPPRLEEGWAPPAQHPKSAPAASGVPGSGDGVLALGTLVALGDGRRCRAVLDTGTAAGGSVGVSAPGTGSHSECRKHQRHRGRGRAELWGLSWLDTNPRAGLTMAPRRNC